MPRARSTQLFILFLLLVAVALGYNYFAQPFAGRNVAEEVQEESADSTAQPEISSIEQLFLDLTPEEKVSQLLAVPLEIQLPPTAGSADLSDAAGSTDSASSAARAMESSESAQMPESLQFSWIERHNPGFITIFGEDIWKSRATELVSTYRSLPRAQGRSLLPGFAVDHEGGRVQRLSGVGYTELPSWREICQLDESSRLELLSETSGELKETGINVVFAPMLDLSAGNLALGNRVCGSDPVAVASRSAEFSQKLVDLDIMPVFKHFPGIGAVNVDLHNSFARTIVSDDQSKIFRDMLESFPQAGVMVTHAGVVNSRTPNTPCSVSEECLGALHRLFPHTLTFTDALEMDSAAYSTESARTLSEVSLAAVEAGNDVLVYGNGVSEGEMEEIRQALLAEYQNNQSFADRVDKSVQKIMAFKDLYQLIFWE